MHPLVVHNKKNKFDVYIGRPSIWGNPFSHLPTANVEYLVRTRTEAIKCYAAWINVRPDLIKAAKEELRGKDLLCWCTPLPCHGEILMEIANEI